MRVSDSQFSAMMSLAMMGTNADINKVTQQIATGNKINNLSDDPAATVKLQGLDRTISSAEQYQDNITNVQAKYSQYETYMMTLNDITLEMNDLLLQAKNSTVDAESATGIVNELQSLKQEALDILNKQSDGVYLFSGTEVYSPAISENPPYELLANGNHRETKVSDDKSVVNNFTASQVLGGSSEFFLAIDAAIDAIQNPSDDFQTTLGNALDVTSATRSSVMNSVSVLGANYSTLDRMMQNSIDTALYASTVQSDINALDYAEASVRLTQSMTALQATQKTFVSVMSSTTLFDLM